MSRLIRALLPALACLLLAAAACHQTADHLSGWDHPGADAPSSELKEELAQALAAKGKEYKPRTRHLREDGTPKFTNRLILESSPYLQQHAHNPVNWYPWGDEAFELAERTGRPVLLSIGYSTCHWCHVMEEESFEDEEIAAYLNEHYVAIKVDREERPDLDAIYMAAVQQLAGRGGWPMTTWLTSDRTPFHGGTYFPPRDGGRRGRRGFLPLLKELRQLYAENSEQLKKDAAQTVLRLQGQLKPAPGRVQPDARSLDATAAAHRQNFDTDQGGRKGAPKFPSSFPLRLMLRQWKRTGDTAYLQMAEKTLERMAEGGIHDQIGGGFHRYTVDRYWLVPHFEKMLYDNALLTLDYLDGYQATGRKEFAEVARRTLEYVEREMTADEGGFYSATDADSLNPHGEREEGWFFTWTPDEMRAVLGTEGGPAIERYFGVSDRGNLDGRSILHRRWSAEQLAAEFNLTPELLMEQVESARESLYRARLERPAPLLDDKILASWNGMMISAMARGGFILDEPRFVQTAERAAEFVVERMRVDGRLRRSYKEGNARHAAFLQDYACVIAALIELFEINPDPRWLAGAVELQAVLDTHYLDKKHGGYFLTADDHEKLLTREKPARDRAVPGGNSIEAMNLLRLYELTLDQAYLERADDLLRNLSRTIARAPELLLALDFRVAEPREVVIVHPGDPDQAEGLLEVLRESYLPHQVRVVTAENQVAALAESLPIVTGKVARRGQATAYVCRQGSCQLPTTDPDQFRAQLSGR